jgi:hypothetical protein
MSWVIVSSLWQKKKARRMRSLFLPALHFRKVQTFTS